MITDEGDRVKGKVTAAESDAGRDPVLDRIVSGLQYEQGHLTLIRTMGAKARQETPVR